jgi:predicted dehydrogenase
MAAKAGKDVYSEKPCGMTVHEIQQLSDGIRRYGRIFQAGTHRRSQSNFRYAVSMAHEGVLGKLHTLHASVKNPQKIRPKRNLQKNQNQYPIKSKFSHRFINLSWFCYKRKDITKCAKNFTVG